MEILSPEYQVIIKSKKPLTYQIRLKVLEITEQIEILNKMSRDELLYSLLEAIVDEYRPRFISSMN